MKILMQKPQEMYTFVCFKCRTAKKGGSTCVKCGTEMEFVGKRFRTPKKRDKKGWKTVEKIYRPAFLRSTLGRKEGNRIIAEEQKIDWGKNINPTLYKDK